MKVSMLRIIQTGRFGDVSIGMTTSEVVECLGPPDAESADPKNLIWKYGSLQLFFHQGRINLIAIYCLHKLAFPKTIEWQGWIPKPGTTLETFQCYLTQMAINFRTQPNKWDETSIIIVIGNNIKVFFQQNENGATRLYAIYLS